MADGFDPKWNSYLALVQKKFPTVPEARIKAALCATNGSAGMAKTMLALPWVCARCARDGDEAPPAHKGWHLTMNAWICRQCADEGWAPAPLNKGWCQDEAGTAAPEGHKTEAASASRGKRPPERLRTEGPKAEGRKAVPELASVSFGGRKEDESFDVTVAKLSGESATFACKLDDTVGALKWKVELEWQVRRLRQVLTLGEDILDDDELLWKHAEQLATSTITLVIAPEKKEPEEFKDTRTWKEVSSGTLEVCVKGHGQHRPTWWCWEEGKGKRAGKWVPLSKKNAEICGYHTSPEAIHTGLDKFDQKRYREKNYIFWSGPDLEEDYPESLDLNVGDVLLFAYPGIWGTCEPEMRLESKIEDEAVLGSMDDDELLPFAYVNGKKRHSYPADYSGFNWVGDRPNDWLIEGYAVCFKAVGKGSTTLSWTVAEPEMEEDESEGDE